MKNKKSIAMAMAMTSVATMVAPAFAAQKTTVIDVALANGKKEGATQEQISDAYQALQKAKSELEAFSKETYVDEEEQDKNGNDIVKNRYTITVKRTASTVEEDENGNDIAIADGIVNVKVVNNLVNDTDKTKEREYSFINIDRVVVDSTEDGKIPGFDNGFNGNNIEEAKTEKHTISYKDSTFNSNISKIKEAIKAEELKYELQLIETKSGICNYKLILKYDAFGDIKLKDIAHITINDVPVGMGGVTEVLIPEKNDFTGHWAEAEIKAGMLDKWVNADSTFRPNDSITRAEFVKIVNRAFNIPTSDATPRMALDPEKSFEDVDAMSWYYKDVVAAVKYEYINGYETTTTTKGEDGQEVTTTVREFRPNQPITRQEAAKMIASAVRKAHGKDAINEAKDLITSFADDSDIAVWADQSVQFLKDNDISNGYNENGKEVFKPLNKITRAEALVMMQRATDVKKVK